MPVRSRSTVSNLASRIPVVPLLVVLLMASSFLIGVLWTKVAYLEKGVTNSGNATTAEAPQQQPQASITADQLKGLFSKDLVRFGDAKRKVLFVEVADPSCPYCQTAAGKNPELNKQLGANFTLATDGGTYTAPVPEMKKLVDSGKASFVYVYYPGHGRGEVAATSMYCAMEKNKFWPVHDKLMTKAGYDLMHLDYIKYNPTSTELANRFRAVTDEDLVKMVGFLKDTGIDTKHMTDCLTSKKYVGRLTTDADLAASFNVTGTPGFFVNTTPFAGAFSWEKMKSVVEGAL